MFKLIPLVQPTFELKSFHLINCNNQEINQVDSAKIHNSAKFLNLVDCCQGYDHLYYTFYYELPILLESVIRNWQFSQLLKLQSSPQFNGVRGLITTSLDIYKEFVLWACDDSQEPILIAFGNLIYNYFRDFPYFQDLSVSSLLNGVLKIWKN